LRILVCDDDDVVLHWLESQLLRRGFEVFSTSNGDQAWATYRKSAPFDFVLSDYQFGRGSVVRDGVDLVGKIREISPAQQLAIMTSEDNLRAPCPVFHKPFKIERILRLFRLPLQSLLF
jgi:CheY-like chemotaxis protein